MNGGIFSMYATQRGEVGRDEREDKRHGLTDASEFGVSPWPMNDECIGLKSSAEI